MPVGIEKIVKVAQELEETKMCSIDLYLKGAIEGVVIKWATQINDVMIEIPSNAFNNGQNPLPNAGNRCHLDAIKQIIKCLHFVFSSFFLFLYRNHILE